ncbi:unnamed protein product [Pylaiella littoralis]
MACLRALAAVCYAVLLATTGQATALSRGGKNNNSFSRRLARLSAGRSTAWADRHHEGPQKKRNKKPLLLLRSLRGGGGGEVVPELSPYSWIAAEDGDGGTLVRRSTATGAVVAGGQEPASSDGGGKVAAASVTAAAAAIYAKVRSGRGGPAARNEAAAAEKSKAAAAAAAAAQTVPKALKVRAEKDKKSAAAKVLKEKRDAAAKAAVCAVEPAAMESSKPVSVAVSKGWPMFSAFLYFLAMAFTIPVLPKIVNELVTGSKAVTAASATLYGLLSSTDASFTLLSVNFHASMSDKYGRRPFLALSALGLGTGFFLTYHSRKAWMLLVAAAIDGCTSCMYSMAQACITDCVGTGPGLGEAFGMFQGLALGMAFMIGLPLGGVLGAKYGLRFPLLVSVGLCVLNFLMIAFAMPETLPKENRVKQVNLKQANPLGAVRMASRNKLITGIITCWTLLWIAHVGLQINWINYTDRKFGWGVAQSGASLALMGLLVAVFPKLIIPRLGLERSITAGLLTYTVGQLVIASAPGISTQHGQYGTPMVVAGLVLASAGTITFPSMLAYLCNQARTSVGSGEVGALQGTTDTAKTICSVVFGPAMAWIFGYFISDEAYPRQIEGANYYLGAVVAMVAWLTARRTFSAHGALDKFPPNARAKR